MVAMALPPRIVANVPRRPLRLPDIRRWSYPRSHTFHSRYARQVRCKSNLLYGWRQRKEVSRTLRRSGAQGAFGGQPHLSSSWFVQAFHPYLCGRCHRSQRPHQVKVLPSAARLAPPYRLLVGETEVSCRNVGPRNPRLLQVAYRKRRAAQRSEIRPQWFYHHVPRFTEEHRQAPLRPAACSGVAEKRRI